MQKRGSITEEQLFFLAEAVFLTVIAFSLFFWLHTVQGDRNFEEVYLSKDISMLLTAVQSVNGGVSVEYPLPQEVTLEFTPSQVSVSVAGTGGAKSSYPELLRVNKERVASHAKFTIERKGGNIIVQ